MTVLRQLEIDLWLSQLKTRHDLLIEIGVGEAADLHFVRLAIRKDCRIVSGDAASLDAMTNPSPGNG